MKQELVIVIHRKITFFSLTFRRTRSDILQINYRVSTLKVIIAINKEIFNNPK